jgi:hypothetical protein
VNRWLVPVAYALIRRGVKAVIRGRDIGQNLITLIESLRATDVEDLLLRLGQYAARERTKLLQLGERGTPLIEQLEDRVECIIALCDGIGELAALRSRIDKIFADYEDDGTPRNFVLLGTIHRIKGLEAPNVFVLNPELIPHPLAKQDWERTEERNLAYIVATRAKFSDSEPGRLIFVGRIPDIYDAVEPAVIVGEPAAESTAPSAWTPEIVAFSLEDEAFVEEEDDL